MGKVSIKNRSGGVKLLVMDAYIVLTPSIYFIIMLSLVARYLSSQKPLLKEAKDGVENKGNRVIWL